MSDKNKQHAPGRDWGDFTENRAPIQGGVDRHGEGRRQGEEKKKKRKKMTM